MIAREICRLQKRYGPQGWWPRIIKRQVTRLRQDFGGQARDKGQEVDQGQGTWLVKHGARPSEIFIKDKGGRAFEVAIGAILTQNAAWSNVEKALICLAKKKLLTPQAITSCRFDRLASYIKSSGYYKQKSKKLKIFARFVLEECDGDLTTCLLKGEIRDRLLSLWGVGPETADTILLYALGRPSFVVDAYTRRWLLHLTNNKRWSAAPYEEVRNFCERSLARGCSPSARVKLFQEAHALIVRWGKSTITKHGRSS